MQRFAQDLIRYEQLRIINFKYIWILPTLCGIMCVHGDNVESEGFHMNEVKRVSEPIRQDMDEITELYWDNWLLISNVTENPKSGVVRYYCKDRDSNLNNLIMDMDKDFDTYGDCVIRFIGHSRGGWIGRMGA